MRALEDWREHETLGAAFGMSFGSLFAGMASGKDPHQQEHAVSKDWA